jgi:transposase
MNRIRVFVGLDYHQSAVQVCVVDASGRLLLNGRCSNDWKKVVKAVDRHGEVAGVAIEACTGAADLADELVQQADWTVHLAHPGYVSRMKQSPDKTDFSDAQLLADLERVGYLPRVWLAPTEVRELRRLVRYRQQLVDERRHTRLRMRALLRDHRLQCDLARPWSKGWLWWVSETSDLTGTSRWIMDRYMKNLERLHAEIDVVEAKLEERTASDEIVKRLRALKGIGPVTAWTLRAEIGHFDRFRSGKQVSRFCGLSPRNASSGTRQADAGLVKAGNRYLRAALIEAGHRLMRYERRWMEFAEKLRARGKPHCVIVAAVANRWMRWLYHQMQPTYRAA